MSKPIRIVVIGSRGRMGAAACAWIRAEADLDLAGEVEKDDNLREILISTNPDVALDFTTAATARVNSLQIVECGVAPVIGTSGLSPADLIELKSALDAKAVKNTKKANTEKLGGLVVPNFSIGAVLAMRFAEEAARWFSACEVIEAHHATKADAPSGTARATAERVGKARGAVAADASKELIASVRGGSVEGVRVHSIRMPGVIAHQEAWFGAEGETLKITHDTTDRACFRAGVLLSLRRVGEVSGLVTGLESLLFNIPNTNTRR